MSETAWKIAIAVFLVFLLGVVAMVVWPVAQRPGRGNSYFIVVLLLLLGLSLVRYFRKR